VRPLLDETDRLPRSRPRSPPLGAVVRVLKPEGMAEIRLRPGATCKVGSAPESDLVVRDPTVSRAHAELSLTEHGVSVVDLGSRNGTFYVGQRVERIVLGLGSRIELGGALLALEVDRDDLQKTLDYEGDAYRALRGTSSAMRRVFALLKRLEGSLVDVLVEGESGVGKELIANAIHEGSAVAEGPLVSINCGALPRELVASELFGHKKGAFTGAIEARRGAFESANGGTLFLDEIGDLPLELQPMLLRVLETGDVRPVGDDAVRRVEVRIVAATNRDLEADVAAKRFREDLFYRLAVVRLRIPPLRERPDDVAPLAELFARAAGLAGLPNDVMQELKSRDWPGNVRELRNAVQAYAALGVLDARPRSKKATLDLALKELVDPDVSYAEQKDALVDRFTALYLESLMESAGGNQTVAARMAGLNRGHLGKLLAKHGVGKLSRG
jgi:DNA-binding NtrC family response regulator